MRLPWADDGSRADGFRFREDASAPDRGRLLLGHRRLRLRRPLIRAFAQFGWFADIRGAAARRRQRRAGHRPARHVVRHRPAGHRLKIALDVELTDAQEKELADLGFIPLSRARDTPHAVFHGNPSLQRPQGDSRQPAATANARLSAMLQYIFCVSRFAHYVKVIGRDRIGSFQPVEDCQEFLRRWLLGYTIASDAATSEQRARYPLREVDVSVRELPGRPGLYSCVIHLRPHFQLDQMASSFRLVTEIALPARPHDAADRSTSRGSA